MSVSNLLYRDATIEDIAQLKLLGLASYGQFECELEPEHLAKLKAGMADSNTWLSLLSVASGFICASGGDIIGMAFLVPSGNPSDIFKAEWSYIRMVGVHPAYQGQGIARTLTEMCIAHARELQETTLALHTSEIMHAARHIYEKAGFKMLHEIPARLGKRYWIYTLDL